MAFGTFLDRDGFFFDTTHFPKVFDAYPFRGSGCYRITGKVDEEFGFCSITVSKMEKLPFISQTETPEVRDDNSGFVNAST
jgi:DNA polymerase-3 subunit alpha